MLYLIICKLIKAEGGVVMELVIEEFGGMAVTLLYTFVIIGVFAGLADILMRVV